MKNVLLVIAIFSLQGILNGQTPQPPATSQPSEAEFKFKLDTGKEIFEAACNGCHGPGGKGQPQSTLGFAPPDTFPDFTDCNGSTREKTFDWKATIHEGGIGRGFSEIMPSFAEALTLQQIDLVIGYLRGLCAEPGWPEGELNLPRAMFTEKAFPEDEWVLSGAANVTGSGNLTSTLIYEKRFGVRNQLEFVAPFNFIERGKGSWVGGIGDLVLGYKRVLFSNSVTGSIVSVQGEAALPTGNRTAGLGSGVTTFEAFGAFGQVLPSLSFLQMQAGAELPTDSSKVPRAAFWRAALGKTFVQNQGFGRIWTPIVEFLADRDFEPGAKTNWDIVPQLQIALNKRQHVRLDVGVRRPVNNTAGRDTQVVFYVLWDWFDGGLRDGW